MSMKYVAKPKEIPLSFAVVSTIPKIVCETLAALGLQEEIPSWKIMDNKVDDNHE